MKKENVYGSYADLEAASSAVQHLMNQGVEEEDIYFVGREDIVKRIDSPLKAVAYNEEEEPSVLDSFYEFFSREKKSSKNPYAAYHKDLERGNILIVVNRELDKNGEVVPGALGPDEIGEYKKTIKLHQDRLHVGKTLTEDSRVRVEKKVIEETRKIEIPLRREELHVTRIRVDEEGNEIPGSQETQVIPVSYESPIVQSETIAVGEADLEKVVLRSVETVNETVLREELVVDELQEGRADDLYNLEHEDDRRTE